MISRSLCATVALLLSTSAAADGLPESVALKFQGAVPNIPGKSLVAVEVTFLSAGSPHRITTPTPPSSTPMCCQAISAVRFRVNRREPVMLARAGLRHPALTISWRKT